MQYEVDTHLAALIERLAKNEPFENLQFNEALWRVVKMIPQANASLEQTVVEARRYAAGTAKKAPTPSPMQWKESVPELQQLKHLTTWKAITDHLDIETLGDSARRKLKNWVRLNKPKWPPVPDID